MSESQQARKEREIVSQCEKVNRMTESFEIGALDREELERVQGALNAIGSKIGTLLNELPCNNDWERMQLQRAIRNLFVLMMKRQNRKPPARNSVGRIKDMREVLLYDINETRQYARAIAGVFGTLLPI